MIRINLLPRDERQVRRKIVLPNIGAMVPVFALLGVVGLLVACSIVQAM